MPLGALPILSAEELRALKIRGSLKQLDSFTEQLSKGDFCDCMNPLFVSTPGLSLDSRSQSMVELQTSGSVNLQDGPKRPSPSAFRRFLGLALSPRGPRRAQTAVVPAPPVVSAALVSVLPEVRSPLAALNTILDAMLDSSLGIRMTDVGPY